MSQTLEEEAFEIWVKFGFTLKGKENVNVP
jgi:hypothetical protein